MQGVTTSSPRSVRQQEHASTATKAGQPVLDNLRIRYGIITSVDEDTSQVRIRLFTNEGQPDIFIDTPQPLLNPLSEIHLLWGRLRKGLAVRFFYIGQESTPPSGRVVEIIGDEGLSFLKKETKENILATGPYKIITGGVMG